MTPAPAEEGVEETTVPAAETETSAPEVTPEA